MYCLFVRVGIIWLDEPTLGNEMDDDIQVR